ncbi:response regulator, partial [Klebsiella pneumoniae]
MMSKTANLSAIIIDDHPLARMAIRNLLENEGFNIVAEAGDGGEALMAVAEYQPDVVIVDVDIPVMSGIEVVEKLRKKQFSHIIIVVSAKNDLFYG